MGDAIDEASSLAFLAGGGEMGERMRAHDWAATTLGPPTTWPHSLRSAVSIMLGSSFPTAIYWGSDLHLLYNDAWSPIPAERHPDALGRPGAQVWPDIWNVVGPQFAHVLDSGEGFSTFDQMLPMMRGGVVAETYWNYSFTAIRGEDGSVAGVFNQGNETTARVLGERRQAFRLALEEKLRETGDALEVMRVASEMLGRQLGASRVGYAEVDDDGLAQVGCDWTAPGVGSVAGRHRLEEFGVALAEELRSGRTVRVDDAAIDALTQSQGTAMAFQALAIGSTVDVPLLQGGKLVAVLFVHDPAIRRWSDEEVELIEAVAGRTWAALERARAEAQVRQSESRLRALVLAGSHSVYRMSPDWQEMRALDGHGFLADTKAPSVRWLDLYLDPTDRPQVMAAIEDAIRRKGMFELEHRVRLADGGFGWTFSRAVPILDAAGEVTEWFGAASDVTARRAEAERLRASEAALDEVAATLDASIDHAPIGFAFFDAERRYVRVNETLAAINGVAAADHVGRTVAEIVPENAPTVVPILDRMFATGEPIAAFEVDGETAAAPGQLRSWLTTFFPIFGPNADVRFVGVTVIDITDRKRAEARVREMNESLERRVTEALAERRLLTEVIDGADIFVQVADRDFNWLAINEAASAEFARIFGVARPHAGDNMLMALRDLPDQQAAVRSVWSRALAGEEFVETDEFGDPSQDRRCYEMRFRTLRSPSDEAIGAYQFVSDVTERLLEQDRLAQAEAALQQAQKMDAVGQLTGGIAHDFNNLLQGVAGSLDLIRRKPEDPARVKRLAEAGLQAAARGAKLTGQLLAFSRAQRIELKPVLVPDLVDEMRDLLQRTLGPEIDVAIDLDETCAPVLADATQLEMAILNLAINARDAMAGGGALTIRARNVDIDGDRELAAGDYVELSVSDTGSGMPPDVMARAFDPFFTTKEIGKGTGLGLSQVYGIARQAGGTARIQSRPDEGTVVSLLLPRTDRPVEAVADVDGAAKAMAASATILVVDDDPDVRGFMVESLLSFGFAAETAEDGESGLLAIERRVPDVLVLDYAMPGMSGAELFRIAKERWPRLPVILASGYADTTAIEVVGANEVPILRKPFTIDQLRKAIVEVLGRAG